MTALDRWIRRAAATCLAALCALPAATQDEDAGRQQFALPLARDAQTLAERVVEHVRGKRREEALSDLQELFEKHATDLLPASWRTDADRPSQFPAYPGAALWALGTLQGLPEDWRARYVERYEPAARQTFELARARLDRETLAVVMRRWPLCPSAEEAAWTLGDLELEAGHASAAVAAWGRAEGLATGAGRPPRYDGARRRERAEAWCGPAGAAERATLSDAGAGGPIPRARATSWSAEAVDQGRIGRVSYRHNAFPVVSAGRLVATNTIEVAVLDAASGRRLWHFPGPREWSRLAGGDDLFEGVSHDHILIAPAVGGGVVVAALQLPISIDQDDEWQGIEIKTPIPERRLFAFDLETGERLWDHAPALELSDDGARVRRFQWSPWSGSYSERMIVSGPPVVEGSRVLVPCYQKQGRIDFHLACYDLRTGGLLWRTALISGQRARNMFGQVSEEFVSTPVTVVGDRVVVQTELGTVASVDLASGQIQWQCEYDQLRIPRTRNYGEARHFSVWREAPPVVVGNVVVSTPSDSNDLLGIDLADGRVLWSYNQERLGKDVDLLLGADDEHVFLAGRGKVVALRRFGGLAAIQSKFLVSWTRDIDGGPRMPRPLLTEDAVIVPERSERTVLDRDTGREQGSFQASWPDDSLGNLWLGEGVLYTLTEDQAHAFFDWDLLLERKRKERAASPDDPRLILAEARLHLDRGQALFESSGDRDRALEHLDEAEGLFGRLSPVDEPRARADRYALERTRAELHAALGARQATLEALETALELAPTRETRADTLLALELLATRMEDDERRAVLLGELLATSDGLTVPAWRLAEPRSWFFGEALVDERAWAAAFAAELPLGAYALLSRAELSARRQRPLAALEDLHAALHAHGDVGFGEEATGETYTLAELIEARIARRLELDGREPYATFDARAAALLDEAGDDATRLEDLVRRYPHARAAESAGRRLVDLAFDSADLTVAVRAVYDAAEVRDLGSVEGARLLSRLADAVGRRGNREFHAGLRASLALDFPDLRRTEEDPSTFADLAVEAALPARARPALPTFDERATPILDDEGTPWYLGRLHSRTPGEPALRVLLRQAELVAFSEADPAQPAWRLSVSPRLRGKDVALAEDRVLLATRYYVEAFDLAGRPAWRNELDARRVQQVACDQGVVIVHASTQRHRHELLAFEARDGTPLWTLPLDGQHTWQRAIFGTGVCLLFSQPLGKPDRVAVVDLFRGVERAQHVLPDDVPAFLEEVAWCRGRRLYLPDFSASRGAPSGLSVLDVDSGESLWDVRFPRGEELVGTVHVDDDDLLVTEQADAGSRSGRGGVYQLDRQQRRATRVFGLDAGAGVLGVSERARSLLDRPLLFVRQPGRATSTSIECWSLETGRRSWSRSIPAGEADLYHARLPHPAVAERTVALCYETVAAANSRKSVTLEFLDLDTGLLRDRRDLRRELRDAEYVDLVGVGPTLFLLGHHATAGGGWLEILETSR